MPKYLLSVHTSADVQRQPMSEEDQRRGYEQMAQLESELRGSDALRFSGKLLGTDRSRVVRPSNGRVSTTDGPYAETKEHLAGFYIVEATDDDAAHEWAGRVAKTVGMPIELRPFIEDSYFVEAERG